MTGGRGRGVVTLMVTSLALLATGCGAAATPAFVIEAIQAGDGDRDYDLVLGLCGGRYEVATTESADRVEVSVTARGGEAVDGCADVVSMELEDPLGERRLIDAADGERIATTGDH